MKKFIVSIIFFSSLIGFPSFSHVEHYKEFNILNYELFRNNKSIGYHRYNFERKDEFLKVKSVVEFKISKLGVDLYKYFAKSDENYKNNTFHSFNSKTNQNKKNKYVNITKNNGDTLTVDGTSFKGETSNKNIVGTWWNHEIIKAKAQISAISGRIIEQKVTFLGKKEIELYGKKYNALHFNFSSSDESLPENKKLNTDVWYEEDTYLWLKASFKKSGNWEYRLKSYK